ncbi:MAG: type I restriction enzyme HsdR N-terminal domain-containing protein [Dehalococcoidia bacterium]
MPTASRKHYSKLDADFIAMIFGVIEGFRHKGKPYLSYLQSRERNDEFLMRDNIVKPLFVALGYHPQQDFGPEETIPTGRPDTIIHDPQNHPVIVIETQSSLLKDLTEHQRRLHSYSDELAARFAILSDGVRLEAWHHPEGWKIWAQLIKQVNLQDAYRRFLAKGIDGLSETEVDQLLKLRYLSREFTFVSEEELYKEPELDVSDPTIFSQLLEDLQGAMRLVAEEIQGQLELRGREYREYQQLLAKREAGGIVYDDQLKKFSDCVRVYQIYGLTDEEVAVVEGYQEGERQ